MDTETVRSGRLGYPASMSLSPGDHLGPYEILSPIGEGGMGEVWKARDTRLNRMVAIRYAIKRLKGCLG